MNKTKQVRLTRQQVWCDADKLALIQALPGVCSRSAPKSSYIIVYAENAEIDQEIKTILEDK